MKEHESPTTVLAAVAEAEALAEATAQTMEPMQGKGSVGVSAQKAQPDCSGKEPHGRLICFVCTGNTCRSPMAEAVFNHLVSREAQADAWMDAACSGHCSVCGRCGGEDEDGDKPEPTADAPSDRPRAISAGLSACPGDPISENAVLALERAGIPSEPGNDYRKHTAQPIDYALLQQCDLIVGISQSHAMRLLFAFPELASRITAMPHDIPDPFGGSLADYEQCLRALTAGIEEMFFSD